MSPRERILGGSESSRARRATGECDAHAQGTFQTLCGYESREVV